MEFICGGKVNESFEKQQDYLEKNKISKFRKCWSKKGKEKFNKTAYLCTQNKTFNKMEEIRIDTRKYTQADIEANHKNAQICFQLNQAMPYSDEYWKKLRELFG